MSAIYFFIGVIIYELLIGPMFKKIFCDRHVCDKCQNVTHTLKGKKQ